MRRSVSQASSPSNVAINWPKALGFLGVGVVAGYFSGLFGIGGGILIVPLLVFLGVDIKIAAPTSLAAVFPISIVGTLSYAFINAVNWPIAGLLALGAVIGAQMGAVISAKLSRTALQFAFAAFLIIVAASLFLTVPSRTAVVELDLVNGIGAVATGLLVGTLASILGIGGGVMVVPALMLGFGASDLVARGTSIAMMVPTSASGTIAHVRSGRAELRVAGLIALGAIATTWIGTLSAQAIDPKLGSMLFAALLVIIAAQLAAQAWNGRGSEAA